MHYGPLNKVLGSLPEGGGFESLSGHDALSPTKMLNPQFSEEGILLQGIKLAFVSTPSPGDESNK